jgi:hypothetical protein
MSVMTGALVIPIFSVKRDQPEEKRMRGSSSRRTARGWGAGNRSVIDMAAHVTQAPIEGVSFAHTFNQADAPTQYQTQYYEMFGHRSIYDDGWRAVCPWPGSNFAEAAQKGRHYGSPIDAKVLADIEANDRELYDLTTDYAESKNLAADNRDKVIEMVGRWWAEAGKYNVMPLDGSLLERLNVERPTIAKPRDSFVYYPGGSPVPFSAAPKVYNRAFSITADVQIPEAGAEGVLVAHGGRVGGYSFFVKDSRLHFVYNFLGRDFFTVVPNTEVPAGDRLSPLRTGTHRRTRLQDR